MTISVAVMAHPARADMVPSVVDALDAEPVVVFDQKNNRWDTGRRSLLAYDPAASHHLVVQDDAILCRDLVAGLERALKHVPAASPLGLYTGRLRPRHRRVAAMAAHSLEAGSPWLVMEGPWWGVAIVMPTHLIDACVAWGDDHPQIENYDTRITRFFAARRVDCWYTMPSLVDHRTDHRSLIPGRTGIRSAHRFIGADVSATSIDWAVPPPGPPPSGLIRSPFGRWSCWWCGVESSHRGAVERHIAMKHELRPVTATRRT